VGKVKLRDETSERRDMGAPVIHFEIISDAAERLQDFYSQVFDWKIDSNNPVNYGTVDTGGDGINGGIGGPPQPGYKHVTFYVGVDDPDEVLKKIEELGGETVLPTTELPGGIVTLAQFKDPDGNLVGLVKNQ
jgi:predicted enzyme related to lactoylglutathione lyase